MRMLSDTQKLISFFISIISLLAHRINLAVVTVKKIFRPILKETSINILVHSKSTLSRITSCTKSTFSVRIAMLTISSIGSSAILDFNIIWMSIWTDGFWGRHSHIWCLLSLVHHLSKSPNLLHRPQDSSSGRFF